MGTGVGRGVSKLGHINKASLIRTSLDMELDSPCRANDWGFSFLYTPTMITRMVGDVSINNSLHN